MNYIDDIAARIGDKCGMRISDPNEFRLLRIYALLALTAGVSTTLENVHDAWAAWRSDTASDHKSLIPFGRLSAEVQALDEPYRAAIVDVASELPDIEGKAAG